MEVISYLIQTTAQIPANDDWLTDREREILAGLRFQKRRKDWLLGRWTAKQAICRLQNASLPSIEIRAAKDGAPEVYCGDAPARFSISLSHSRDRSICAVCSSSLAVGCDLEWIEPRQENFADDYFTPEEISFVLQAPLEKSLAVNLVWSAKESCLKSLRKGLGLDTRSVVIKPDIRGREAQWNTWTGHCMENSIGFCGWWRAAEGYIYTISADRPTSVPREIRA